jgi:alpha-amylase/alpha-mannosidase (GH57 family)
VAESIATMQRCFGVRPRGCWPPEAAVSSATLALLGDLGFEWAASAGAVLSGSLQAGHQRVDCVHRPFVHGGVQTFFRDDGLSDLIGFTYKTWPAADAVDDLVGHLERIARHCERPDAIVTIALDGENAWEHYPENAYDFLDTLYRRLSSTPGIRLTTFSEHLDRRHAPAKLDRMRAGSWVYGTLATWIGHPEKNRAWELLIAAKQRFDAHGAAPHTLERLLAICEGSDWFWWLGDDNATTAVESFDRLFRAHLTAFYSALGEPPPAALQVPLSHGSPRAIAHMMRPTEPP